jgi:hypothetical protein
MVACAQVKVLERFLYLSHLPCIGPEELGASWKGEVKRSMIIEYVGTFE